MTRQDDGTTDDGRYAGEVPERELRRQRDELLEELAALAPDDPAGPAGWALAGDFSYELFLRQEDPEDLRLAADALERAFARPDDDGEIWDAWRIVHGHVLAFRYDRRPGRELLERAQELIAAGLAGPGREPEYEHLRVLGRYLLARFARLRWAQALGQPDYLRRELLDQALERHRAALPDHAPGSEQAAELHEGLGGLHHERYRAGGGIPDAESAAEHYRAALAAPGPESDLGLLRYGLATALMVHGQAAVDRELLQEARSEFGLALVEAGQRSGERPWWGREAAARQVVIRALLWWQWGDQSQVAAALAELEPLLAEPDALDELLPTQLDAFGRLLYDRAAERDDQQGRERALRLVQLAFDRWQAERDGPRWRVAAMLAMLRHRSYRTDRDPEHLRAVAGAGAAVLADEHCHPDVRRMITVLYAGARLELVNEGLAERDDSLDGLYQEAYEGYRELQAGFARGDHFLSYGDGDFSHLVNDVGGIAQLPREFDRLYTRWRGMDPAAPEYGTFAGILHSEIATLDPHASGVPAERRAELFEAAAKAYRDDPVSLSRLHSGEGRIRLHAATAGDGSDLEEAIEHLEAARRLADGREDLGRHVEMMRSVATGHRGQLHGGADDIDAATRAMDRLRDEPSFPPYMRRLMDGQLAGSGAVRAARGGDLAEADRCITTLAEVYHELEPEDPARGEIWTMLENSRTARDHLARAVGAPLSIRPPDGPTVAELRRQAARLPRDRQAWVLGDVGLARTGEGAARSDQRALDEGMALVQEALALSREGSDDWLRYASGLGSACCATAAQRPDRRGLETGLGLLERAARLAGGPEHRLWASINVSLGRGLRLRADPARADRRRGRRCGLDALRGFSWAVLLQSGTGHAAQAAAQATAAALEAAAWCLEDGAPEEAVQALDACRGLVLHAATTSQSVPEMLTAAGERELAEQWRAAGAEQGAADGDAGTEPGAGVPSELRRRVLTALTGSEKQGPASARLLDPPAPDEIGTALRTLRADALVYLMPASEDHGGAAVLVTADGGVHSLPLPLLKESAGPLRDYLPGGPVARDLGPAPFATGAVAAPPPLRRQLDRLCAWAWYAAVRPLLELLVPPPGRTRPPSLILVPMGALGAVPWHAAWCERESGEGRRYAVEAAEIAYAASARLLCDVAARPSVPHTGSALIVGNPTGDLHYAGEEADAVQRAFYPRGSFLGRRAAGEADGPGTPAEVLGWLRGDGTGRDGGVLHLACHATVAANQRYSSYLSVSGGELAAEELTEAAGRRDGRLELVVLAACRSHVSGRGHNEAYSLATAFLVAGARSVIGSLWPVPDDATSVLMFMTHHYLRREQEQPGRALRRAQLWMLDSARRLPPGMPPVLAARAAAVDPDDLSAWAGFTHLGR
ncbi:CHAT domain-containing protein [Kitasatospora sp. HPMI-4]|uniref:CHAT domain-containing protein n=1 Tax=Kitasatospora sp. HPMI-4 TaxID=3448443 RepID=UPI003F1BD069